MTKLLTKIGLSLLVVLLFTANGFAQFDIPEKPKKVTEQTSVYDYANLLKENDRNALETKLFLYADTTSTHIVIAIIAILKGEYEVTLAPRWAHQWGIVDKDKVNGVFILLAEKA